MSNDSKIQVGSLVLSRFEIRERIARGGFAVVWKANDRLLGKDVALKVLQTSIADDPAAIEEMKRETLRSRELTHPNIVQTYDFVQDGPVVAIAMELIDGDTMATLAAQRPNGCFNPPEIAGWLADICDALDFAHSEKGSKKPVVHHDLKPSNFIVDRYGTAKVLDFGISKNIAETQFQHTGQFAVAGTPPYMSPQQLRGKSPKPSDDIYSFGATVYALLARKPPFFRGDIPTQIMKEIPPTMNARRTELGIDEPPIPMEWEETIASCLRKEPELRPKTIAEVAVSLGIREPSSRRTAAAVDPSSRRGVPSTDPSSKRLREAGADPSSRRLRAAEASADHPSSRRLKAAGEETTRGTFRRRQRAKRVAHALSAFAVLAAVGFVLWPCGPSEGPEPKIVSSARPPRSSTAGEQVGDAVSADAAGGTGFVFPDNAQRRADAAAAEKEAKERAEKEAQEREARRTELHADVSRAIGAGAWRDAGQLLPELLKLAPDDPEVAKWATTVGDQLAVRDVVQGYRMAQEARDADAYASLWAGLDDKALRALRNSYAGIRTLSLAIDDLTVRVGASTATVRFRERITFDLKGVGNQTTDAVTVLTLQKNATGWKIAARDTEQ
ncbi:MAG: protein kinase [bacterium]